MGERKRRASFREGRGTVSIENLFFARWTRKVSFNYYIRIGEGEGYEEREDRRDKSRLLALSPPPRLSLGSPLSL